MPKTKRHPNTVSFKRYNTAFNHLMRQHRVIRRFHGVQHGNIAHPEIGQRVGGSGFAKYEQGIRGIGMVFDQFQSGKYAKRAFFFGARHAP